VDPKKKIGPKQVQVVSEKTDSFLGQAVGRNQDRMATAIRNLERKMINSLRLIETDRTGRIESVKVNLKQTQAVHKEMLKNFEETYGVAARQLVSDFDDIDNFIQSSWTYLNESADFTGIEKNMNRSLRRSTARTFEQFGTEAQRRIDDALYSSIVGGTSYSTLVAAVTGALTGHRDARGRSMAAYAKQYAFDATMNYHNDVNLGKAEGLGIFHFLYVGDIIGSTRKFCRRRAGKVYTRGQINSWNQHQWEGKAGPAFTHRGGYNCRHHWRPVRPEWLGDRTQVDIADWRIGDTIGAKPSHLKKTEGARGWLDYTKTERNYLSILHKVSKRGGEGLTSKQRYVKFFHNGMNAEERRLFREALEAEGIEVPEILRSKGKTIKPKPIEPSPPPPKPEKVIKPQPDNMVKPKPKKGKPDPNLKTLKQYPPEVQKKLKSIRHKLVKGYDFKPNSPLTKYWFDLDIADRENLVALWESEGLIVPKDIRKGVGLVKPSPNRKLTPTKPKEDKLTPKKVAPPPTPNKKEVVVKRDKYLPPGAEIDRNLPNMDFKFKDPNTIHILNEDFESVGNVRFFTLMDGDHKEFFIDMIYVDKKYQGKGYGTALIDDLLELADQHGVTRLGGESMTSALRKVLDKKLGKPIFIGDPDYIKKDLSGIDVIYEVKPKVKKVKVDPVKVARDKFEVAQKKYLGAKTRTAKKKALVEYEEARRDYAVVAPSDVHNQLRKDIIGEMGMLSYKEEEVIFKGTRHLGYEVLTEMKLSGLRIDVAQLGRASYNPDSKTLSFFHYRNIGKKEFGTRVIAHEVGHAVDSYMSNKGRDLNWKLGFWDDTNPWAGKRDAIKYHKWYEDSRVGGKAWFNNGDGQYHIGNWVSDYEGRIYPHPTARHPEFFSMGSERYAKALESELNDLKSRLRLVALDEDAFYGDLERVRESLKGPVKKADRLKLDQSKKRLRNWVHAARLATGKTDLEDYLGKRLSNPKNFDHLPWGKQIKHYPEYAQWMQDFYRKTRKTRPLTGGDAFEELFEEVEQSGKSHLEKVANTDLEKLGIKL